jgi:hypothetical protein
MENTGYTHFAEALVFAHGARAAGEAARHALLCERSGTGGLSRVFPIAALCLEHIPIR